MLISQSETEDDNQAKVHVTNKRRSLMDGGLVYIYVIITSQTLLK